MNNNFDELINYMKNTGKEVIEPEICRMMTLIGKMFNPNNILDPNAGMGEILYYCNFGQTIDAYSLNQEYIKVGRDTDNRINFIEKSFLKEEIDKKYDLVISQIPFTYEVDSKQDEEKSLDIKYLEKIFKVLNKNGVIVALLPGRFLCEEYSKEMRRQILDKYSLEMIIEFPYDFYKIKNHDASIVVIKNTEQRDKVLIRLYDGNIQNIIWEYLTQKGEGFIDKSLLNKRWDSHYNKEEFNWLNFYKPYNYKTIGELSKVSYGPMLFNGKNSGEVLILSSNNIRNGEIILSEKDNYLSQDDLKKLKKHLLEPKDVLAKMKMDSDYNIFQYKEGMPKAIVGFDYIIIRPEDEYFKEFISTIAGRKFIESQFSRLLKGAGKNLDIADVKMVKIPLFDVRDIRLIEKANTNSLEEQEVISRLNEIKVELSTVKVEREKEGYLKRVRELEAREALNIELLNYVKGIKGTLEQTNEKLKIIDHEVKEVRNMVKDIYNMMQDLHNIQDKMLVKLNNLNSEAEKEEVYKKLSDNIWELINEKYEINVKNRYDEIEKNYEEKFTTNGWQKLDDSTRRFLITSKVVYYDLKQHDDVIDFSPCCIALTKALEREIFLNVFYKMKQYFMSDRNCDLRYLPDGLVYNNRGLYNYKFDDKFTLGSVPYLLATSFERVNLIDEVTKNKKKASVNDFINNCLFKKNSFVNNKEAEDYINNFSYKVQEITKNYRNESAHKDKVERTKAESCYKLIISTDKILIEFINKLK